MLQYRGAGKKAVQEKMVEQPKRYQGSETSKQQTSDK
jgi:hypothetical protein